MVRPYTQFYHDLEEALIRARLSGTEYAVFLAIQRLTIGWKGKSKGDYIPVSRLSQMTGRDPSGVRTALQSLSQKKMLLQLKVPTFSRPAMWRVNDNLAEWENTIREENTNTVSGDSLSQCEVSSIPREETSSTSIETFKDTLQKTVRSPSVDIRFTPLKTFLFSKYKAIKSLELRPVFNASDGKALKEMLKDLPEIPIESFQSTWIAFLLSEDQFYRKMHGTHPVRYWASNINAFFDLASNGSKAGHSRLSTHNARVGQDWLSRTGGK